MVCKREKLVTDYNVEVLSYILQQEQNLPRLGNYLQGSEVKGWMRDKLMQFVVDLTAEIGASVETAQLAVTIIDLFLSKTTARKAVLQLVGVVGMMIALKFHESMAYTLEHAFIHSGKTFKKDDIKLAEIYAMQKLGWKLEIPTAAELSRQLVYITGVEYDFTKILERSDSFAMICYTDYNLSQFSIVSRAVVSVVCALEQFNQISFRNQWLNFLNVKLSLDIVEVDECKRFLIHKLYRETPANERSKLECLSRDSIATFLPQQADKPERRSSL
jgi:hypothetical protein